jgi:transposase
VAVPLARKEKRALKTITQKQCSEARLYRRARMILLAHSGESISAIARKVGTSRSRVGYWIERFERVRLDGLPDAPRSGRPVEITPLERHQVIATACRSPKEFDMQRVLWSHEALADAWSLRGLFARSVPVA